MLSLGFLNSEITISKFFCDLWIILILNLDSFILLNTFGHLIPRLFWLRLSITLYKLLDDFQLRSPNLNEWSYFFISYLICTTYIQIFQDYCSTLWSSPLLIIKIIILKIRTKYCILIERFIKKFLWINWENTFLLLDFLSIIFGLCC